MKTFVAIFITHLFAITMVVAQDVDAAKQVAYTSTITARANKIISLLGITDSSKFYKVQNIIVAQYRHLSTVHDSANAKIKTLKVTNTDKELIAAGIAKIEGDRMNQLSRLHQQYFTQLSIDLSPEQIVKVKDGMTYNILPITVKAYQEMLPTITEAQKAQIITYLTEAREYAVDAESSDKKHAWFGKYKGKINNYLSAAGIDMKKAGQDWEERIKATKKSNEKQP